MAQRVVTFAVDDMDGTTISGDEHVEVRFSFEGKSYDLDLSRDNWETFQEVMDPYVRAARKAPRTSAHRATQPRLGVPDPAAVRTWAAENGYTVSDRGRIPTDVYRDYREKTGKL